MTPLADKLRIAIRADASREVGTGHLMRCLTLADGLSRRGHDTLFVTRDIDGVGPSILEGRPHRFEVLPRYEGSLTDPWCPHAAWLCAPWELDAEQTEEAIGDSGVDWMIADSYALHDEWEGRARQFARRVMAMDDVADRSHDVDLLLDQNLRTAEGSGYADLVPQEASLLLGPGFALLRPEFRRYRAEASIRRSVRSVLVFMGGGDPQNMTSLSLDALEQAGMSGTEIHVVLSSAHPNHDVLAARVSEVPTWHLHVDTAEMAKLMAHSDLAIGAGGSTTWERAAVGLPAVLAAIAENQVAIAEAADAAGFVEYVGRQGAIDGASLAAALVSIVGDESRIGDMSRRAFETVDAMGTDRVADRIEELGCA